MSRGWRIFWSSDVPRGVRPGVSVIPTVQELTRELDLANELHDLLLGADVVAAGLRVEEADSEAVLVKERARAGNLAEDHLEVVNTLAALLEGHRARVVDEDDDVEERNLDEVDSELGRKAPLRRELLERAGLHNALRDALDVGRVAVERANVLLLVSGLQRGILTSWMHWLSTWVMCCGGMVLPPTETP